MKDDKVWLGYIANQTCIFRLSDDYKKWDEKITAQMNDGHKYGKCPAISVFTNLDIKKRHEKLILWKNYSPEEYLTYDNYNAVEVSKTANIPCDYNGIMGVPITFLDRFNPTQFEIIGFANGNFRSSSSKELKLSVAYVEGLKDKGGCPLINGKLVYPRILIRRKVS